MTSSKSWGPLGAISVPLPSCMCFPTLLHSLLCQLCRCIATWKQPAVDGPSSSAERMAAWTSREHGRSTRRWEATNECTHFPSMQRSIQIHSQRDANGDSSKKRSSVSVKLKSQNCSMCKTSRVKNKSCLECVFWRDLTGSTDPRISETLQPSIIHPQQSLLCGFCISNSVQGVWDLIRPWAEASVTSCYFSSSPTGNYYLNVKTTHLFRLRHSVPTVSSVCHQGEIYAYLHWEC